MTEQGAESGSARRFADEVCPSLLGRRQSVVVRLAAAAIKEAAAASIVCATAHLESLNAVAVTALRTTTSSRRSCTVLKNLRPYYIQHCVSCRCISCATTLL